MSKPSALAAAALTVPWRATKFEAAKNFGPSLKGLFLHVELIQPRRGQHHPPRLAAMADKPAPRVLPRIG